MRGQMAPASHSTFMIGGKALALALLAASLSACNPVQSALHPAGVDAANLSRLFWFMTIGGALVWCIVMGCAIYAVLGKKRPRSEKFADRFILVGGVAFPTIGLAFLLVFGLSMLPDWDGSDEPDLRIHVVAEQFWWRMNYELPDGNTVETANELHLPVNSTVEFVLYSHDVIHSFWIPALGGKMDMIPGRTNLWRLRPTETGVFRGVCAEFCGPSHALMAFQVVVHDEEGYQAWLAAEQQPASPAGAETFIASGCGACHVVRGVSEAGSVGPDLTHFASRRSLGADTLPITAETLHSWLAAPSHIKPGVRMPSFGTLPQADRDAIVAFLLELK